MISVENLVKKYDGRIVLNNISFTINRGEVAVLIGPNGAGKTTLLKCIAGLTDPDQGRIVIEGETVFLKSRDVKKPIVNKPPYERDIGYLPSEQTLFPHMTIWDNIALPLIKRGWSRSDVEKRVREILEITGLNGYEKHYPHQLSNGLKQRAMIARILVYSPKVILLDEPFSSIDISTRVKLREELLEIQKTYGFTMFLTTHSIDDVVFYSQHILVLVNGVLTYNGRLVEEEIVKNEYLLDSLDFIKIPVETVKCIGDGEAVVNISGQVYYLRYNEKGSLCIENTDQYLVVNPGYVELTVDYVETSGQVVKGIVYNVVDEMVKYILTIRIGSTIVKYSVYKNNVVKPSVLKPGEIIYLKIPREHTYLVLASAH